MSTTALLLISGVVLLLTATTTFAVIDADGALAANQQQQDAKIVRNFVPHELPHNAIVYLNATLLPAVGHEVQRLDASYMGEVRGKINYTLGSRVKGDLLVARTARNQTWSTPHNVRIVFTYPTSGLGAQVTYVAVQVMQSNNLGKAAVVAGGLHQRMISVAVEAYNVQFVNCSAQFYGVP